jgi:hypothetical protein
VLCTAEVDVSYTPEFQGNQIVTQQSLNCGMQWQMTIPSYIDLFGKKASVDVDLADAGSFLSWESADSVIKLT